MKKILSLFVAGFMLFAYTNLALASSVSVNFENPPYVTGSVNGQDGWMSTGPFDQSVVVNTYGFSSFGAQTFRISDAVTSGSFGDQTFAKPLTDSVGEVDSTNGSFAPGTKQTHFEMEFDFASALPTYQPGMHMSVSPDRGDGSRMSYLTFNDSVSGVNVIFYDVQGTSNPANFVPTQVATNLDRSVPHTVKLTMDVKDGPSNDVVKVWIDGTLVHTGTSWENYYRYDSESAFEQSPRIVKTVLFRQAGTANPANSGKGFLVDNLSLESLTPVMPSVPAITSPANGATVTVSALTMIDWTDSTGTFTPMGYYYEAYSDSGYTGLVYASGLLSASEIATPGTPPGDYYVRVRAMDTEGNLSDWSNGASNVYKITVIADTVVVGPPTSAAQCKNGGWMTFNNPTFKNQGDCVSYVQSSPNAVGNKTN